MQTEKKQRDSIRVVERTIDILQAFTAEKQELSLSEVAQATDLPKTTAYRILSTLEQRGLVMLDAQHTKYRLSYEFIRMGSIAQAGNSLPRMARTDMEWVTRQTGQTCNLYIRDGMERRCIAQVEGTEYVRRLSFLGAKHPLYCGAGKLLLAFAEPEFREMYFRTVKLERYTENTIVDRDELLRNLEEIRSAGYSVTRGERDALTAMVAVPLLDYTGKMVAAITVSGPVYLFTEENVEQYRMCLTEAAEQISSRLGYRSR